MIYDFIYNALSELVSCLQGVSLSLWDGDNRDFWSFLAACCGGYIVFDAICRYWRKSPTNFNYKGW